MHKMLEFLNASGLGFSLKLVTGLVGLAFGILGIGTKTRDDNGKLTRPGRIALIGIVVAGLLTIATTVTEFWAGQKSSADELRRVTEEQQRAKQLLLSVRRGIYPLKGLTASLAISIHGNLPDFSAYKAFLDTNILQKNGCASVGVNCGASAIEDHIRQSSPLFPNRRRFPRLRNMLDNLSIQTWLYSAIPAENTQEDRLRYKLLGSFSISWHKGLPPGAELAYKPGADDVRIDFLDWTLDDEEVPFIGVYSLVDFIPGLIAVEPAVGEASNCDMGRTGNIYNCIARPSNPSHLDATMVVVTFGLPYPKSMGVSPLTAIKCNDGARRYLVQLIPRDIDLDVEMDNRGTPKFDTGAKQICDDVIAAQHTHDN